MTDEQVRRLGERDDELDKANRALREEWQRKEQEAKPEGSREASGGGRGRGGLSGGGGGSMGGRRGGGDRRPPEDAPKADRSGGPTERLDENDTKAYLDAESFLTEQQRPQAQKVASAYRAQLYDRRRARKGRAGE